MVFTKLEKLKIAMYLSDGHDGQLDVTLPLELQLRVEQELTSIFNNMSQDDKYNYGSPENFWLSMLEDELYGEIAE